MMSTAFISLIYFKMSLGGKFTEPTFATDLNKFVLVNMFLGCTLTYIKAEIMRQYSDVNVSLRIIFDMSSFGMAVGGLFWCTSGYTRRSN